MSKQQMPARIWCDDIDVAICKKQYRESDVMFIRADIAERMAEALEECRLQIEYMQSSFETGSCNVVLSRIRSALSAFKDIR